MSKTAKKTRKFPSDKELKALNKNLENVITKLVTVCLKAAFAIATEDVEVVSIVFRKNPDGKTFNVETYVNAVKHIDGDGKIHYLDPATIKSIEYSGGDTNGEEE